MNKFLDMLRNHIASPGDPVALDVVRKNARDIVTALVENDRPGALPLFIDEKADPEWVADVYDALAGEVGEGIDDREIANFRSRERYADDLSIGRAYRDYLLPDLLPHSGVKEIFAECPPAPKAVVEALHNDPSVIGSEGAAEDIVRVGLTPLSFFDATKAVAALARRMIDRGLTKAPILHSAVGPKDSSIIDADILREQIEASSGCLRATVPHLHRWLFEIAIDKPKLFPWFFAELDGKALRLEPRDQTQIDLKVMWGDLRSAV